MRFVNKFFHATASCVRGVHKLEILGHGQRLFREMMPPAKCFEVT
jgi:hypothetical protein